LTLKYKLKNLLFGALEGFGPKPSFGGDNMVSSCILLFILVAILHKKRLDNAFYFCLLICQIAFLPVFGDVIEAVPGQSIEGHLNILVSEPPGHHITITLPSDIAEWRLIPDETNELTAVFNVKANKDGWQVAAKDNDPVTSGHMTELTGSDYGSLRLASPMRIKAACEVTLPNGGMIQTGSKTTGQGQNINVAFIQESTFADEPLPEGHVYRIVITFAGSYTM
jgi:hypothetical protein